MYNLFLSLTEHTAIIQYCTICSLFLPVYDSTEYQIIPIFFKNPTICYLTHKKRKHIDFQSITII